MSWLVIDIYGEIHEYDLPVGVMSELMGGKAETLTRILGNMEMAAVDDRIEGVVFKMSSANGAGRAMMEEMRGAIGKVRESGKKVYGFSDSMDRNTYYLASACDRIFMPRTGYFIFNGMAAGSEHILGTLEKLGVKPQIHAIKDYKSAAEMITRKDMSPASRENKDWMLAEYWDMFCSAVGKDRGFTEEQIVAMMEKVLFTPAEAVEAGLIDSLMYWDEIEEMLKPEGNEKFAAVTQSRYAEEDAGKLGFKGKKKIAVIHAQGMIGGRSNRIDPMFGVMMGHESIVAEFKRAQEDKDVAAIVFRVDSPGGESLASDLIGHQVEVTAKAKPVVVSMVDVAASGGYHIAYRASKIVADPMTLTGSIGSISGKANVKGLFDKLGVTHDFTTKGPQALFYSEYTDFDEKQWKIFTENHWTDFNASAPRRFGAQGDELRGGREAGPRARLDGAPGQGERPRRRDGRPRPGDRRREGAGRDSGEGQGDGGALPGEEGFCRGTDERRRFLRGRRICRVQVHTRRPGRDLEHGTVEALHDGAGRREVTGRAGWTSSPSSGRFL